MNENPLSLPNDNHPDPDDAEGFFRRGNRHLDAGSYDSAIADYSAAIQLDPTDETVSQTPINFIRACLYSSSSNIGRANVDRKSAHSFFHLSRSLVFLFSNPL